MVGCAAAVAQPFPVPITAERPVSAITRIPAAGSQSNPRIATNGDLALVAWVDTREGVPAIYGARLDAAGNVLDPFGVRLSNGSTLSAVAWSGESFVLLAGTSFTFVSPDLATITTRQLPIPAPSTFKAMTTGADPRFLFFEEGGRAAVIDARGDVVVEEQLEAANGGLVIAGANDTSFLVLRDGIADHIDRDGTVLSTVDANASGILVPFGILVGGPDGFLLTGYQIDTNLQLELAVHWFNASGVRTGSRVLSKPGPNQTPDTVTVVRETNRYVVIWFTNDLPGRTSSEFVTSVGTDSTVSTSAIASTDIPQSSAAGIAMASGRNGRFLVADLGGGIFIQTLPETLQPPGPISVTNRGIPQAVFGIAAGTNGYAITWIELDRRPTIPSRVYVRRFSESGVPQDDAPIPFIEGFSIADLRIASNGDTYLLGWRRDVTYFIRRLDALHGDWIDPAPIPLGMQAVSLASNGRDAIAFGTIGCGTGGTTCLAAQRISLAGPPLVSPVVSLRQLDISIGANTAVASNGTDYLAVSFESPICMLASCVPNPGKIYATRLRADGTAIDALPIKLTTEDHPVPISNVAWAGGRYLVVWPDIDGVRGARVTAEGAVLDRDPHFGGVLLAATGQGEYYSVSGVAAGVGTEFVLLLRHNTPGYVSTLEGVAFDARGDLAAVPALPRTILAPAATIQRGLVGVGRGSMLAVAFDRLLPEQGNSQGTVFRLFAAPAPRHRVATH